MMKLPILACAEKLETLFSLAHKDFRCVDWTDWTTAETIQALSLR